MRALTLFEQKIVVGGFAVGGGALHPDGYVGDDGQFDYTNDFGTDASNYGDSTNYFGDFGDYYNQNDNFDEYSGVDSGVTTTATSSHDGTIQPGQAHYEYHISTGQMFLVDASGNETAVGTGYSGDRQHVNDATAQGLKDQGPIPAGDYSLTGTDNHKGPNTITLSPSDSNNMQGRDNFLIHGDNSYLNHSASQGCIILGPSIRSSIVNSGVTSLRVVN